MIVVDTSALMAILLEESDSAQFETVIENNAIVTGAPTKFEFAIVATGRLGAEGPKLASRLLSEQQIEIADWTDALADIASDALLRFGKGRHPAALNYGDCMIYALAKSLDVPLLYKGNDFAKTDIRSAL